jgi:hypothetical protein
MSDDFIQPTKPISKSFVRLLVWNDSRVAVMKISEFDEPSSVARVQVEIGHHVVDGRR